MGEREPLDNPQPTHGVCAYHKALVLEALHRETVAAGIQGRDRVPSVGAAISANQLKSSSF